MSEERLEEIKDSIVLQKIACKTNKAAEELINEELELYNEVIELKEKVEHLKRTRNIMQSYLQLIADLTFDNDRYNTVEDLKGLIQEVYNYALYGRDKDDRRVFYEDDGKKYNILGEEIK